MSAELVCYDTELVYGEEIDLLNTTIHETISRSPIMVDEDGEGFNYHADLMFQGEAYPFDFLGHRIFAIKEMDNTVTFYCREE